MNPQSDPQSEIGEPGLEQVTIHPVGRRMFVAGATGLGLATLLGVGAAFAQDDSDEEDDTDLDETTDDLDDDDAAEDAAKAAQAGEAYQNFVGKLTTNLGLTDTATVDLAIRDALKAMVDEKFAEGSISQNDADALKERIDTGVSPLGVVGLAGMRGRGRKRRRERIKDAAGDGSDVGSDSEAPTVESTPSI